MDRAVMERRLIEERDVPGVEIDGPDGERDVRVGQDSQPVDRPERKDRAEHRPRQPDDEAERRQVAEQNVLDHVDHEEVAFPDLVDRGVQRQHDQSNPQPEEPPAPGRNRCATELERPHATQIEQPRDQRRRELERFQVPARQERCGEHVESVAHRARWRAVQAAGGRTLFPLRAETHSYAAAGVSLAVADAVVERLRAAVESTGATGFGAFAGLHPLDDQRLLAASTDGVGTKLILARARGQLRACGADLAAHCINDVLTTGATPLMLLDYVAANEIHLEEVAELVEGAAEVCRAAGVALVGGETAELPGIYQGGELDFAGTCVGIVDRDELVDGSKVEAGDVVIGVPSNGVHANGFTLVRRILEEEDYDGPDLLAPTRLYLDEAKALRGRAKAFAHITGGGILGNLSRVLPAGRTAEIDWDAWARPPVFGWLARHVEEDELRRVFNLGIGWCAVVATPAADETVIGRIQ
jgi:phosphoribosylformylglycinamidine cyclo-ligase